VRAADGIIATFDVPGASMGNAQGTYPRSINPEGDIAGFYYEASHIVVSTRGFVRADGTITTFDAGPNLGTIPLSINPSGEITGVYTELSARITASCGNLMAVVRKTNWITNAGSTRSNDAYVTVGCLARRGYASENRWHS
jgi:hypothetical protein